MKQRIIYILSFCCAMLLMIACTEESTLPVDNNQQEGRLVISYSLATSPESRATEAGWNDDWHENDIERLDLFIFDADGNLKDNGHYSTPDNYSYQDPQNNNSDAESNYHEWDISASGIKPTDIETTDQIYLIANCESVAEIKTINDLKEASVLGLVCNTQQSNLFVMDGKARQEQIETSGNDVTISIDLYRAASKIRIAFANNTPSWSDENISYRFVNYATSSSVIAEGEDAHLKDLSLVSLPVVDEEMSTEKLLSDDETQLVLYSYANNWLEENKVDIINQEEPINEARQTYVLLYAPYQGDYYYYKIPVNYRLPKDNDAVIDEENKDSYIESIKNFYCLQRNYIYDITVSIDRKGGGEEETAITLEYQVVPFEEKDEIDYTFQ